MDALHKMVDMNSFAMSRTWWLAEELGVATPESSEVADEQAKQVHEMLFRWEADITGTRYEAPPSRRTRGDSPPPGQVKRTRN